MIITAQPFFNELDLLELKFRELEGIVDLHVVVEATTTFTGKEKPLHFLENAERFKRWRVWHNVVKLPVNVPSPWEREAAQYAAVRDAVRKVNPEIVMWLDADEVPRRDTVERFKRMNVPTATIAMEHILFYFDCVDGTSFWTNAKIGRYDPKATTQPWRGMDNLLLINHGGWHFEYFGGREHLLDKLGAVSHAPEPGCQDMTRRVKEGERPGLERCHPYPLDLLPGTVRDNPRRWASQFYGWR